MASGYYSVIAGGEKRFSPFFCWLEAFGVKRSIEDHYQCAKVFELSRCVTSWRQAKEYQKAGVKQTGWLIGGVEYQIKPNDSEFSYKLDDWGIQWYIALWLKYLKLNPELVEVAKKFDDYEDPFKGRFPFCQADVIRKAAREGVESLRPMCQELLEVISNKSGGGNQ